MPGRRITTAPQKPAITAPQRRGPTFSFRNITDSSTAKIGAVKNRTVAVASGIEAMVQNPRSVAKAMKTPRIR